MIGCLVATLVITASPILNVVLQTRPDQTRPNDPDDQDDQDVHDDQDEQDDQDVQDDQDYQDDQEGDQN